MKKNKLNLADLSVKSFVTSFDLQQNALKGGAKRSVYCNTGRSVCDGSCGTDLTKDTCLTDTEAP